MVHAISQSFKACGLSIDIWYYESDFVDDTRRIIEDLIKRGIVVHSEGAWIVNLEEEGLGVNLLVKTDGTLLYNAKDLALAMRKEEDHHPRRSLYVIDVRQSLAMQQLFATLKRMGFKEELQHLAYEFVTTKDGAMASRKGNVVSFDEFRSRLIELSRAETAKRHIDWNEKKQSEVARKIAFAAMRFGMLKQDLGSQIVFDLQEALSFDGCTGPYLLYTGARLSSIIKKAKRLQPVLDGQHLKLPVEHALLMQLSQYPEVVFGVGASMHVSHLSKYLFDLCQTFASYYEAVPVLVEDRVVSASRLAMVIAVLQVLENGLSILGIEPITEM